MTILLDSAAVVALLHPVDAPGQPEAGQMLLG